MILSITGKAIKNLLIHLLGKPFKSLLNVQFKGITHSQCFATITTIHFQIFFLINPSKLCTHQIVTPNPSSRKTSTSASLTTLKPLTVWVTTSCGKFLKRWEYQTTLPAHEKPECRSRSSSLNQKWNKQLVPNWKRNSSRLYIVTWLI